MTDAEMDARLERLSDDDLLELANSYAWSDLRHYRPGGLYVRMARELLELRRRIAEMEKTPKSS